MGATALACGWALHRAVQSWYAVRPGSAVHPLLPSDLAFDHRLLMDGLARIDQHLLHLHPFGSMAWMALAALAAMVIALALRREWDAVIPIAAAVAVMLLALGIGVVLRFVQALGGRGLPQWPSYRSPCWLRASRERVTARR